MGNVLKRWLYATRASAEQCEQRPVFLVMSETIQYFKNNFITYFHSKKETSQCFEKICISPEKRHNSFKKQRFTLWALVIMVTGSFFLRRSFPNRSFPLRFFPLGLFLANPFPSRSFPLLVFPCCFFFSPPFFRQGYQLMAISWRQEFIWFRLFWFDWVWLELVTICSVRLV